MATARLHKSTKDRMLFGVAGGLGEYFSLDPVLMRLIFVLTTFAGGAGLAAYVILAIILPSEHSESTEPKDIIRENLQNLGGDIRQATGSTSNTGSDLERHNSPGYRPTQDQRRNILGIIIIIIGILLLLNALDLFSWFSWGLFWAVLIIIIGVAIIVGRTRR